MKKSILSYFIIASALLALACASHVRKERAVIIKDLTAGKLLQIHQEVRFTSFYYADGKTESGLLLHWEPDSIVIQKRGEEQVRKIPTSGIEKIETVTGNHLFEGLSLGVLAAGGYFAAVQGWKLSSVSFLEGMVKLLVPPAIIVAGLAYGAARETKESYRVPPGFQFDYKTAKRETVPEK